MIICGIDASTKSSGMSLFNNQLVDYALINFAKMTNTDERINKMMLSISKQLDVWNPDLIYIEDSFDKLNVKTLKYLSYIVGSVRLWALLHNKEFYTCMPSHWRKIVGISKDNSNRDDFKKASVELVKKYYGIDVIDDVSDSILIGLAGLKEFGD